MKNVVLAGRLPTEAESASAGDALRVMSEALSRTHKLPLKIETADGNAQFELPESIGHLLLDALSHIARGEAVQFVPFGAVLTTQQAADYLNVSRPFLIKLLDDGKIPHHRVGSHRRVKGADVITYRETRDAAREGALAQLQALGQEMDTM